MVTITFFKLNNDTLTGYRASGHAGYGKYGQDIVCAAVSVLTQATGKGILQVAGAKAEKRIDESTGFYELKLKEDQPDSVLEKAQVLLKTLEIALVAIANDKQYSGSIRINYTERR